MKHIFTSLFYAILVLTLVASARAQTPELPEPPPASIEQPFTVALRLDVSGSTVSQMEVIRTAANSR